MERKLKLDAQSELALQASDAIIAISADAIISTNEAQEIIRFNHGAEAIFGYESSEIVGQRIDCLIPSRFHASHSGQMRGFAESPTVARRMGERRQISGIRKNGEEFPAEASISKTRLGDQWMFTVALRDVTDRLRAEQGQRFLAEATALLNGSLDVDGTLTSVASLAIPVLGDWCVVFLADERGSMRRALAVHEDPARASDMERLKAIPFSNRAEHPLVQCLASGVAQVLSPFDDALIARWADVPEHEAVMRDLAPVSAIIVPLIARDHSLGAICFFRGVTSKSVHADEDLELAQELGRRAAMALDNAKLYANAQAAINARNDVMAIVSHDLGNPLAAVRLSSTLLLRLIPAVDANKGTLQQVENIRSSVLQMERLIKDLMDVTRIESGILALEKENVLVRDVLDDVFDSFAPLVAAKAIDLVRGSSSEMFYVHADRERLMQLFSNLVGNASKFSATGASIRISATQRDGEVSFRIEDTGAGIPADHLPHIFDRFWQARRTGRHGIGLGLAIVKGIANAHSGRVTVTSELGAGSTFTVILPAARRSPPTV